MHARTVSVALMGVIAALFLATELFTWHFSIFADRGLNPVPLGVALYFVVLGILLMARSRVGYWLSIASVVLLDGLLLVVFSNLGFYTLVNIPLELHPLSITVHLPVTIIPIAVLLISIPLLATLCSRSTRSMFSARTS